MSCVVQPYQQGDFSDNLCACVWKATLLHFPACSYVIQKPSPACWQDFKSSNPETGNPWNRPVDSQSCKRIKLQKICMALALAVTKEEICETGPSTRKAAKRRQGGWPLGCCSFNFIWYPDPSRCAREHYYLLAQVEWVFVCLPTDRPANRSVTGIYLENEWLSRTLSLSLSCSLSW
jgi:hypothetical protein